MVTTCSSMPLNKLRKCSFCFICPQQPNCNTKLYPVHIDLTRHSRFKAHVKALSKVEDCTGVDSTVNPSSSFLDNIQWFDTLLDESNESLNNTNDDFQNQLQELFDEVKSLISKGSKKDAVDLLRANYRAVKEQLDEGYRGVEEAAFLDVVALGYGCWAFQDCGLVIELGEALDCLISIQARLGEDGDKLLLNRVLAIQEKEFGNESEEVMTTLKKIVFYLNKQGRKDEKFPVNRRLTSLRKKLKQRVTF